MECVAAQGFREFGALKALRTFASTAGENRSPRCTSAASISLSARSRSATSRHQDVVKVGKRLSQTLSRSQKASETTLHEVSVNNSTASAQKVSGTALSCVHLEWVAGAR